MSDWRNLGETFRDANRRAADHIPAKLGAVACAPPFPDPLIVSQDFALYRTPEELELLAELEHESWMIGRSVDGWRPGQQRDNEAKMHPDLIPYADLSPAVQQLDRNQIMDLDRHILPRAREVSKSSPLLRRELRLSIQRLSDSAKWLADQSKRSVAIEQALNRVIIERQWDEILLFSALLPGWDITIARACIAWIERKNLSCRLIGVEPFGRSASESLQRSILSSEEQATLPDDELERKFASYLDERNALIASPRCEWLVELPMNGTADVSDMLKKIDGYIERKAQLQLSLQTMEES
jgi:hypothetical protein